jgi:hypothetical protein
MLAGLQLKNGTVAVCSAANGSSKNVAAGVDHRRGFRIDADSRAHTGQGGYRIIREEPPWFQLFNMLGMYASLLSILHNSP